MKGVQRLLLELVEGLIPAHGQDADPVRIDVQTVELELPIESAFASDGGLLATTVRGRLKTGFELRPGRLRARVERTER